MALRRRSGSRFSANIWPGFVDAMTALLLVLMFVLTIFMIVQFVLRDTITGQDAELDELSIEIQGLASALGLERNKSAQLQGDVSELNNSLAISEQQASEQKTLIDILTVQSEDKSNKIDEFELQVTGFEAQVAGLLSQTTDLSAELRGSRTKITVLTGESNALKARNQRLASDIAGQASALVRMQVRNQQLSTDAADQASANAALLVQNRALTADAADRANANAALLAENRSLAAEASDSADANAALLAQNRQLSADAAGQSSNAATLRAQNEKLAADVAGRARDNAQLAERNRSLNEELARRGQQVAELEAQNQRASEQAEGQADENAQLADQNRLLLADKDALKRANLQVISESEALQLALVQARDEMDAELETARLAAIKREAMQVLLEELQRDVSTGEGSLTNALAALAASQTKLTNAQGALAGSQGTAADAQQELASMLGQLEMAQANLARMQQGFKDSQAVLLTTRDALAAARNTVAELQVGLTQSEKDLLTNRGALTASQNALAENRRKLAEAKGKLQDAQSEVTARGLSEVELRNSIAEMAKGLSDAEKTKLIEAAAAAALRARLQGAQDELTAMTLSLEAERKAAEDTLTLLAAAENAEDSAQILAATQLTASQKNAALLAVANSSLAQEKALSAEGKRKVTLLNRQTVELRKQLDNLQGLLDQSNARDVVSKVQIEALGSNLNAALAQVAADQKKLAKEQTARADLEEKERIRLQAEAKDLKKFRSEFFGRLRDVLGAQEGIRIVGDRFVFSSEILFGAGSADLGDRGKVEIGKVAGIIFDVADQIPDGIDWILRVDGHTDKIPLSGFGKYNDNWELSQARALSVVKYLIDDLNVPAGRLAANGFGEFQPIIDGDSPDALALNRRIELKFTEK